MDNKSLTIAICLPMGQSPSPHFAMSLAAVTYVTRTRLMLMRGHSSMSAAKSRNIVLEKLETIEQGTGTRADWTVWFDDDMIFPSNTIARLLSHNKEIVGASYLRRTEPYDLLGVPEGSNIKYSNEGIAPFRRLPAGCILIRRDVFDKVGKWAITNELGEDSIFCDRARDEGFGVWCDLELTKEVKHVGEKILEVEPEASSLIIPHNPDAQSRPLHIPRGNGRG